MNTLEINKYGIFLLKKSTTTLLSFYLFKLVLMMVFTYNIPYINSNLIPDIFPVLKLKNITLGNFAMKSINILITPTNI